MKKRTRYLIALAAAALVALALAAPVVAHQLGTRGMSGSLPLYNAALYDGSTIDRHGPEGTLRFDMTTKPYKIKYILTARGLQARTKYALIDFYCEDAIKGLGVRVLREATTTRRGTLYVRGAGGADDFREFTIDNRWVSGAQVGVIPSSALHRIGDMVWVNDADVALYAVAGLPTVVITSGQ